MLQHPSAHAATAPDRPAIITGSGAVCTYGQLDARSNRIARLLRKHGLGVGDHIAILLENRLEFLEVLWGGLRAGVYVTPINWHLNAAEAGYIVNDCGASLLFASSELLPMLGEEVRLPAGQRIAVGCEGPGVANYETVLDAFSDEPIADQCEGS